MFFGSPEHLTFLRYEVLSPQRWYIKSMLDVLCIPYFLVTVFAGNSANPLPAQQAQPLPIWLLHPGSPNPWSRGRCLRNGRIASENRRHGGAIQCGPVSDSRRQTKGVLPSSLPRRYGFGEGDWGGGGGVGWWWWWRHFTKRGRNIHV